MNNTLRALYVCYLPLSDPLVETQVVRYLEGLAAAGHVIHLLTFETERRTRQERTSLRRSLAQRGIAWHALRYHHRPSLPATIGDTLLGAFFSGWIIRRHRLDVFHARVHVPAAMALIARMLSPHRLLFDVRGLMAEEYVDAGRWTEGGVPWRMTKWVERKALEKADAAVVLTPFAVTMLPPVASMPPTTVIPCCADLSRFYRAHDPAARLQSRARFSLSEDDVVLVYSGKFGGWYLQSEMVEFYVAARDIIPRLKFLVLTQDDPALIRAEFAHHGVDPGDCHVTGVSAEEMGSALAAADFAISFVAPMPSKRASSPTKIGEYLGAGLPVVAPAGVGALDAEIAAAGAGVLVDWTARNYRAAANEILDLLQDPSTRDRCAELARRELSLTDLGIPRYRDVYEDLARLSS